MKRLFYNKKSIFAAILVMFVFGQVMGTIAIKTFFINYKINELSPQLTYLSAEIARGNDVSRKKDFIIKAYDIYGTEMDIFMDEADAGPVVPDDEISKTLTAHIPRVIAGKEVAVLEKIKAHSAESIVIGKPIVKNGNVIGAVFIMKPASDFTAVLNGFYLVFFVTLAVGTMFIGVFLYLYIKETKQLEQTRRDYIANVSHELRSPIASIKALTETLADNLVKDEETKGKYYGIILRESSNLQKLISDMLELSRLQSGSTVFQKERISTKAMMQEIYDKYFILADDMEIIFEITDTAMTAPDIYSNRDRLLQLFNILIDNAVKFVGERGRIVIDAEEHRNFIRFKVSDNGMGIEKSVLPYIFDRFYKEDKAHNSGGSGLGLSIAKEIASGLGEEISVSSELGKGTVFSFTAAKA